MVKCKNSVRLVFEVIRYYSPTYVLGFPSGTFPYGFPIRATCLSYLILLDFIILIVRGEEQKNYEAPLYAIFSTLLSLQLSSVQIFSSAPCSQTLPIYVLPLILETKFLTHNKPQENLWFCIF
jgi:hypothetical protein